MTDTMAEANALLSGGGGAPAFKFERGHPETGDAVVGDIVSAMPRQATEFGTNELLFWKDGSPRMEIVVTLQTELRDNDIEDDDGQRRIWLRGDLLKATRAALQKAKVSGLAAGGRMGVRYIGDEKLQNGFNAKKYSVAYKPPAEAPVELPADGPDASDLL